MVVEKHHVEKSAEDWRFESVLDNVQDGNDVLVVVFNRDEIVEEADQLRNCELVEDVLLGDGRNDAASEGVVLM